MANEDSFVSEKTVGDSATEAREHQATIFAKRITNIPNDLQERYDYTGGPASGLPVYVGYGARGLATSTSGWIINKYTYSGTDVTVKQTAFDTWDNRASATYA